MTRAPQILEADFHRNGVGGAPFHVAIVRDPLPGVTGDFLCVTFDDNAGGLPAFAALRVSDITEGNIYMHPQPDRPASTGHAAWRGDQFARALAWPIRAEAERRALTP